MDLDNIMVRFFFRDNKLDRWARCSSQAVLDTLYQQCHKPRGHTLLLITCQPWEAIQDGRPQSDLLDSQEVDSRPCLERRRWDSRDPPARQPSAREWMPVPSPVSREPPTPSSACLSASRWADVPREANPTSPQLPIARQVTRDTPEDRWWSNNPDKTQECSRYK